MGFAIHQHESTTGVHVLKIPHISDIVRYLSFSNLPISKMPSSSIHAVTNVRIPFFSWLSNFCCYCSVAESCPTLCNPMNCSLLGFPVLHYLPDFAQIHIHWVSDAIQPSHPLSSPSPPDFNLSQHQGLSSQLFESGGQSIGASTSAPVLPGNIQGWFPLGLTGLILLAVQGTLKSLLQDHNWKALILWCSAFFMVQLSNPYTTTGKTIALTRWTFVSKVMFSAF